VEFAALAESLFPFASEVGYLALGLVSFFGSLIPFVPIPSFVLLATMAVGEPFNLHFLAIIAAVTATLAKQIIFYISYHGGKIIKGKTRTRMKPFERLVRRYGGGAAFLAAATPVPDDLVYIPLGIAKYNPRRFFLATLLGKLVLSYVIVFASHFFGISLLEPILEGIEDPSKIYIGIIAFTVILTALVILVLRLDWARILGGVAPWTLEGTEDEDDKKFKHES